MKGSFGTPDKKVPQSSKYAHIGSSIDTGASSKKVQSVSAAQAARRRDEIFKRIRPATLARMIQERDVPESVFALGTINENSDGRSQASVAPPILGAPTVASVAGRTTATAATVHSVAGSVLSVVDSDATADEMRDLVLLDLREPEEFEKCRLPLASNYPATKINRDQFSPELQRCKRDPSKLLVVYHTDDVTTAGIATLLVQKGWDNVHALSGGFEEMVQSYAEILDGEPPERPDTGASRATRASATSRR
mmetsp:Transcript_74765/g.216072  ORF Transcript_74765/g.216072 Transcript_74765/m.216072 type:complete len:251 (-) Transcript_74765:83-835(-)